MTTNYLTSLHPLRYSSIAIITDFSSNWTARSFLRRDASTSQRYQTMKEHSQLSLCVSIPVYLGGASSVVWRVRRTSIAMFIRLLGDQLKKCMTRTTDAIQHVLLKPERPAKFFSHRSIALFSDRATSVSSRVCRERGRPLPEARSAEPVLSCRTSLAMFIGLVILLVLIVLCAVVGGIYTYIYFTRINPAPSEPARSPAR